MIVGVIPLLLWWGQDDLAARLKCSPCTAIIGPLPQAMYGRSDEKGGFRKGGRKTARFFHPFAG